MEFDEHRDQIAPNRAHFRLVKSWLPPELVREMDALIAQSAGVYGDRDEFIAEAIRDRIREERYGGAERETRLAWAASTNQAATPALDVPLIGERTDRGHEQRSVSTLADVLTGDWVADAKTWSFPTLDPATGPETNFGLHNRDLPTLFALDILGRRVRDSGGPIEWSRFLRELTPVAWDVGGHLQDFDRHAGREVKCAAGFPTNQRKREAAERRFLAHAAGAIKSDRAEGRGPFFVFRFVGLAPDGELRVAPTAGAAALMGQLLKAHIAEGPPFPAGAWQAFKDYLREHAPAELRMWMRVLALLRDEPDRETLVQRCNWWSGNTAGTNAMGYIARGREWGLVEPRLAVGRYKLTPLGERELAASDLGPQGSEAS